MGHHEKTPLTDQASRASTPTIKRRYTEPAILQRQQIEAMAAECSFPGGKTDPTCAVGFS